MSKRSAVSSGAILKHFLKVARHPWIASKLATLQAEKWVFDWVYPKAAEGLANKVRQVSVRITDVCNLRCVMCGQWGESGFLHGKDLKELKKVEVAPSRYIELLRDLRAHGHSPNLYLWGGEPTLYDGWLDIIEAATDMRFPCSIATNGTRLVQNVQRLVRAPLFLLQVSIDGHCAEVHNAIRPGVGKTDSFASILAGLDAVREERLRKKSTLPLIASLTTVSKDNANHLVDIYETFRNKVDMCVFYPSWWIDEESAKAHDADFQRRFGFKPELHWGWLGGWKLQDYEGLNRQLLELDKRSKDWNSPPIIFIPNIRGEENLQRYYNVHSERFGYEQCISIYQVVEIDSNGDVSPCRDYHDYKVGNVKDSTITEIWNNDRFRKFRRSLHQEGLMPVCTRCCGLMGY
jgi:radical SAM protein with 4Fe4S-binding SPASM domain